MSLNGFVLKIRFTIKNRLANCKAFTYIEVIISLTVVSIMLIPIIMSFNNSVMSFNFSSNVYRACLQANNILVDVESELARGHLPSESNNKIENYIANFNSDYDTQSFDFIIRITDVRNPAGSFTLLTNALLPLEATIDISLPNALDLNINTSYISYGNTEYRLVIPNGTVAGSVNFSVPENSKLEILTDNRSEGGALINIYGKSLQSDSVNARFLGTGGGIVVCSYSGNAKNYMILAQIWDKTGKKLATVAKPLFLS